MISIVKTCTLIGLEATAIQVEVDLANGLPIMHLVGLPDQEIKEAKERVRAAMNNSGLSFPLKRITINLAPADAKKEGTHFDLPIALGIILAAGQGETRNLNESTFGEMLFLGELSLDGRIQPVKGVLPMLLTMREKGVRQVVLPKENLKEAKQVAGLSCMGVASLTELLAWLERGGTLPAEQGSLTGFQGEVPTVPDFCEINGQEGLRRGLEIAAAGRHNLLMIGPPGSGKTMAARCFPSILPPLTYEEALEITKIYSVAGLLDHQKGIMATRPFRAPHHTSSTLAITGGGRIPKPGEVSLSHLGVLFLDELPEFSKTTLEVLRQPLEDGAISLSRVQGTYIFPAQFMLIGAANPCPCGYLGSQEGKSCTCLPHQIKRYQSRLSGPLLDRIDLLVETAPATFQELSGIKQAESSSLIRKRVERANQIQQERYQGTSIQCNAWLGPAEIKKHCRLEPAAQALLEQAFSRLHLSGRGYYRVLRVARTIADLEGAEIILLPHLSEALQYRTFTLQQ